jgi:hypothetical protein
LLGLKITVGDSLFMWAESTRNRNERSIAYCDGKEPPASIGKFHPHSLFKNDVASSHYSVICPPSVFWKVKRLLGSKY